MVPPQARLASPFDLELLTALHGQCFGNADGEVWDLPALTGLLNSPGVFAYLASAGDGSPAGLIIAQIAGDESEILTIGTLPANRRQGVGLALIEAAVAHAAEKGAQSMFLEVAADNPAAQALYRTGGFRTVGRRSGYYLRDRGQVDAVLLRRELR